MGQVSQNQKQKEQQVCEIIVANPNPALGFMYISEIDQSGTNLPQGDFAVKKDGLIHPCFLSSSHAGGYYIDEKKVYDQGYKTCREYTPGTPADLGKPIYQKEGSL